MKTPILAALLVFCFTAVLAAGPDKVTNIKTAMEKAKAENKLLFLQLGRENCPNCQALKGYIKERSLRLSESKFVYADVDGDDPATNKIFEQNFKVTGNTLPFVIVAGPDGKQLAGRTGFGTVKEYEDLLRDAQKALKK